MAWERRLEESPQLRLGAWVTKTKNLYSVWILSSLWGNIMIRDCDSSKIPTQMGLSWPGTYRSTCCLPVYAICCLKASPAWESQFDIPVVSPSLWHLTKRESQLTSVLHMLGDSLSYFFILTDFPPLMGKEGVKQMFLCAPGSEFLLWWILQHLLHPFSFLLWGLSKPWPWLLYKSLLWDLCYLLVEAENSLI